MLDIQSGTAAAASCLHAVESAARWTWAHAQLVVLLLIWSRLRRVVGAVRLNAEHLERIDRSIFDHEQRVQSGRD